MLQEEVDVSQKTIAGLKKEREITKESNQFLDREIVLKNEKREQQKIDVSRKETVN